MGLRLCLSLGLVALLAACRPSADAPAVQTSEVSARELARALGTVRVVEVRVPQGARSYAISQGLSGPLGEKVVRDGRMRVVVGLFNFGCPGPERQDRLTLVIGPDNWSLCIPSRAGPLVSVPLEGRREDLALDRWTPLVVFKPYLPVPGKLVVDSNVNTWTAVLLYFSDKAELSGPLPSTDSVIESLR